jgi:hypothetical protein
MRQPVRPEPSPSSANGQEPTSPKTETLTLETLLIGIERKLDQISRQLASLDVSIMGTHEQLVEAITSSTRDLVASVDRNTAEMASYRIEQETHRPTVANLLEESQRLSRNAPVAQPPHQPTLPTQTSLRRPSDRR